MSWSKSPAHCFETAIEAARIALKYRTPVLVLSDGYLANGAEPWLLPEVADLSSAEVAILIGRLVRRRRARAGAATAT